MKILFIVFSLIAIGLASTECIWAIGKVVCNRDQNRVIDTVVEVWDKDGPATEKHVVIDYINDKFKDLLKKDEKPVLVSRVLTNKILGAIDSLDHDDKAGVAVVEDETGMFRVEGCASDQDWLGHRNAPEFYFRIKHRCTADGTEKQFEILPPVKVFAPNTYDHHMDHPISLD